MDQDQTHQHQYSPHHESLHRYNHGIVPHEFFQPLDTYDQVVDEHHD